MDKFSREDTAELIGLVRRPILTSERTQISLIGRAQCLRDFSTWLSNGLQGPDRFLVYKLRTPSELYGYDQYLRFVQVELDANAQKFAIKAQGVTVLLRGQPNMFSHLASSCMNIAEMLDSTSREGTEGTISPFKYVVAEGDNFHPHATGTDVLVIQGVWERAFIPA